jgi:C_GCAxxG_C_C family probable redox protein
MGEGRVEQAVGRFQGGMLCSQAILSTYGPVLGLPEGDAVRLARGFGSGMARLSEVCGAVSGAFMVLSLINPSSDGQDKQAKEETYVLIRGLAEKFREANGSLRCGDLLGCDLSTPEGAAIFRERGMMQTHCVKYVREAAELLEAVLRDK